MERPLTAVRLKTLLTSKDGLHKSQVVDLFHSLLLELRFHSVTKEEVERTIDKYYAIESQKKKELLTHETGVEAFIFAWLHDGIA